MNLRIPFPAYKGQGQYIFVSYSHRDTDLVFPIIRKLHDAGYNIWYDEGIDPGNEWPEEIAAALSSCALFLVFISPRSVGSVNVRNEINFALSEGTPFIAIHIEETELAGGLKLQIGSKQAIMKHNMDDDVFHYKCDQSFRRLGMQPGSPTTSTEDVSNHPIPMAAISDVVSNTEKNPIPASAVKAAGNSFSEMISQLRNDSDCLVFIEPHRNTGGFSTDFKFFCFYRLGLVRCYSGRGRDKKAIENYILHYHNYCGGTPSLEGREDEVSAFSSDSTPVHFTLYFADFTFRYKVSLNDEGDLDYTLITERQDEGTTKQARSSGTALFCGEFSDWEFLPNKRFYTLWQ